MPCIGICNDGTEVVHVWETMAVWRGKALLALFAIMEQLGVEQVWHFIGNRGLTRVISNNISAASVQSRATHHKNNHSTQYPYTTQPLNQPQHTISITTTIMKKYTSYLLFCTILGILLCTEVYCYSPPVLSDSRCAQLYSCVCCVGVGVGRVLVNWLPFWVQICGL